MIDKQTFHILEWSISILIGFIVFEIISKGVKKKLDESLPAWKAAFKNFVQKNGISDRSMTTVRYLEKDAAAANTRANRVYRDVQ